MSDFSVYQSPYSWRYGSVEMRRLWSESTRRKLWRNIWVALAEAQSDYGLVTPTQVQELRGHVQQIDLPRALQIEAEIHHDLMAEVRTYAEQCPLAGGIIHLGATSMDIEDNAEALRLRSGLLLLLKPLSKLLLALADRIEQWAELPVMAFTHLQPAEPTTLGYRLAGLGQDLLSDWQALQSLSQAVRGKGFKGAVGTAASYVELLGEAAFPEFEAKLSQLLQLPFYPVTTQVYPRKQEYDLLCALAGLGGTLYKFAFDLRFLQSPPIGEVSEPFGRSQVGSSAMPFKRNPIQAEKIDSIARSLAQMPLTAWHNAAHSLLERTLDDSANRRTLLPEAFLMTDELLNTALNIISGLNIHPTAIKRNLNQYGPFAATERVLMALVKAGADRQAMHETLRQHALAAWQAVQTGQENPLGAAICADSELLKYLTAGQLAELMAVEGYIGISAPRAWAMAARIRSLLHEHPQSGSGQLQLDG